MTEVKKTITINAPIDEVFEVITDFETYPEFLPEMKEVTIEEKKKTSMVTTFRLQLMKEIEYTLNFKLKKPTSVVWELEEGQMMSYNSGSWKLKKVIPKKTQATYSIEVKFGLLVPNAISNMLVENNLPEMLENFKGTPRYMSP